MNLPKIVLPEYPIKIPSTGEQHFFTPFLVKHQRALLTAKESDDPKALIQTVNNVISQCFHNKIEPRKLAIFDIIYIFSQLKAMSSGESVDVILLCDQCDQESTPNARVIIKFDLTKLDVERFENHTNNIKLTDDGIGIKMKYPTLENMLTDNTGNDYFIENCIDKIYTADEIIDANTIPKNELKDFVENLTTGQLEDINLNFFKTMPKITKKFEYECPVCKKQCETMLEGLENFFI